MPGKFTHENLALPRILITTTELIGTPVRVLDRRLEVQPAGNPLRAKSGVDSFVSGDRWPQPRGDDGRAGVGIAQNTRENWTTCLALPGYR